MTTPLITRETLATVDLEGVTSFASVEVRRITIPADVHPGAHWHNGPVFGVVESGSVFFRVGNGEQTVLRTGDTFYEPANETITRFDATDEGVTFLAWFPVPAGITPELIMGEPPVESSSS
ncbi:cupin domain-containing protein [Plantibacter sp. LMC-P-059a]|jgi:quercetin dioxygenase-like cupin family protein|uniref:cupin domain-containing protein n=1 Tax=Plantibacter sp. LMC-P-059a TaxID=3040297 RepID=UPI00254D785E|nr:cupin domain-containing protein [Plantibacter sp. LMC-P-059a]